MAMSTCRLLTTIVSGTFSPASATPAVETYLKLIDGQSSTIFSTTAPAVGMGARTTAGVNPFITLTLDAAYGRHGAKHSYVPGINTRRKGFLQSTVHMLAS